MCSAALQYARRGWAVFPCRERDSESTNSAGKTRVFKAKAPYTGQGLKDATRDEQRILAWWRDHPDALIGVPMGVNGCFVLDFDPRVDEASGEVWTLESLKADLETQMGCALPKSITAVTQSDGVHVYFRQPAGEPIRNRGNLPRHVDVRGLGGYVIAPPSVMAETGARYRWLDRGDWRDDAAIAEAPAALIDILRAAKARPAPTASPPPATGDRSRPAAAERAVDEAVRKYALVALDGECRAVRDAPSGGRNGVLNIAALKVASLVAAGALDAGVARASIEAAARSNPGNDDDAQLIATINSGWTAGLANPRDLGEIAAAARSRRDRGGGASRQRPPAPAPAGDAVSEQPFRSGRLEGMALLREEDAARLSHVALRWFVRRLLHVEHSKDGITGLAFSAGRRCAAGLLEVDRVKEGLWAVYETIADVQHADVDRAIDDGRDRGFDLESMLLTMRCSGYPMTDFGIAERFRDRFGRDYRFTTAKGWLGWDGRRWKVLDQEKDVPPAEVIAAVFETVRAIQDEARFMADTGVRIDAGEGELDLDQEFPHGLDRYIPKGKQVVKLSAMLAAWGRTSESAGKPAAIATLARRWLTAPIEDFDRDPLAINVMNGTLRFSRETLPDGARSAGVELRPHQRDDMNTRLAPVEYDPAATSPFYDAWFAWAQPEAAMRRYLHQCAGYAASGDTSEQKLWFWYGLGANGKSTTIDLWAHVLGDYSGTIGIETFLDQGIKKRGEQASPDLARLGGVRMLRASEPERGAKLNEALIKAATGGEPMAVRALHRGFFDLLPLFKLFIGGNYKPEIPGTDEGIWRRVRLIPWDAHVEDKDRDEALPTKLRAESAGVFNHLVRGLLDWLTHGLVEPDTVKQATAEYREDSDPLARFLKTCTEFDPTSRIQSSKLHETFVAWCKAAGEREWTNKGLAKAMASKGFTKKASDGMQWLGLRLTRGASDFVDSEGKVRDFELLDDVMPLARGSPAFGEDDMPL